MKRTMNLIGMIVAFVIATGIPAIGQEMTKEDYLARSKRQKTGGLVLTATGVVVLGAVLLSAKNSDLDDIQGNVIFGVTGAAAIVGGLLILSNAGADARRASELSFKTQPTNMPRYHGTIPKAYPSLTLSISLNRKP